MSRKQSQPEPRHRGKPWDCRHKPESLDEILARMQKQVEEELAAEAAGRQASSLAEPARTPADPPRPEHPDRQAPGKPPPSSPPPTPRSDPRQPCSPSPNGQPAGANAPPASGLSLPQSRPKVVPFDKVAPCEVQWLWPGRIPQGCLTVVAGRPGVGKSLLSLAVAASVSTGQAFPDGTLPAQPGTVLLLCAEDDPAATIRPRLDAAGADLSRVHLLEPAVILSDVYGNQREVYQALSLADLEPIKQAIEATQARLLVLDPLGSYLRGVDAHRETEVRAVFAELLHLVRQRSMGLLVVAHLSKSQATSADNAVLGSIGLVAQARAVWHVIPDPQDRDRKLFLPGKSNLAAQTAGLAYRVVGNPPRTLWEPQPLEGIHADDYLTLSSCLKKDAERLNKAVSWLRDALYLGPRPVPQLVEEFVRTGGSERTLYRAAQQLGVARKRSSGGREQLWELPESARGGLPPLETPAGLREDTPTLL